MKVHRYLTAGAIAVAGAGLLSAASALAHHASGPFYDSTKKVEAQGRITKFLFTNPHAFLYVEAADAAGQATEWQVELGAPVSLRRTGWTPDTLKPGLVVKVVGAPSRAEGTHGICCARITLPDGSPVGPGARLQEEQQPPR